MLIMLFSDTNYVLDGFHAEFHVTNCPMNCSSNGLCKDHTCHCDKGWQGEDCSEKVCDCGVEEGRGVCNQSRCECSDNWSGQTCSLHKTSSKPSQWIWLTNSSNSFTKRTAHTAIYHDASDSIYVFGGYDLNEVLGSMEVFRFSTSLWEDSDGNVISSELNQKMSNDENQVFMTDSFESENSSSINQQNETSEKKFEPSNRYGHAACVFQNSFVIFGGKLFNGSLSNELYQYNISSHQWILRATNSILYPPKLTRHTLTYVSSNGHFYIIGGSLETSEFSSKIYRIKLRDDPKLDRWEEVYVRGGKKIDFRMVGHSCNYHDETNSLYIYGGIVANSARLSKLSDRLFSFDIENNHWSEIFYPKHQQFNIPRERAFHSATVVGSYIVVFGGYHHRHNKEEICYDNQIYLYHLVCHYWISQDILGTNHSSYPRNQGIFSHAAVLRGDNTLVVIGGYQGIVNNDLLAFTLPDALVTSKNLTESEKCSTYKTSNECIANPECGWCSSDNNCYGRSMSNCYANLQTTRCPGICPALKDCQSCLIHGSSRLMSPNKLPIEECLWCVENAKCHQKNDRVTCGESESIEKIGNQWWGRSGTEIADKNQCTKLDKPPGMTVMKYFYPFNFSLPDDVTIVNSTSYDFTGSLDAFNKDPVQINSVFVRLTGFLILPTTQRGRKEDLKICASFSDILMAMRQGKGNPKTIANFTAEQQLICNTFNYESESSLKMFVNLQAKRRMNNPNNPSQHTQSRVSLQNNASKTFTFEYLEPYCNLEVDCGSYKNCIVCSTDSRCGWCDITGNCMSRDGIDEKVHCSTRSRSNLTTWDYLITQAQKCENCSNHIDCESCTNAQCEWMLDETKCLRAGRSLSAVQHSFECPSACYQRKNCSRCLGEKGRCVWCEATQECFSFSVYTSEFQYGACREWIDQNFMSSPNTPPNSPEHHHCKSCSALSNCSDCLKSLSCGWCYFQNNPIEGTCISGDFNSSVVDCNNELNTTELTSYTYASCPDYDECLLGIDDCNENADCINTDGSYVCSCRKGYAGDGRKCERTCTEVCQEGRCSNFPDYVCICDLGWTGPECSVDCGCNNHSTCKTGVGKCDECQEYTEGDHCERCIVGSYGNATNSTGCNSCDCNGHGDPLRGYCDQANGKCFCQKNSATEGDNCEDCVKNYYGDPRNGGKCFLKCQGRSMLNSSEIQGIGSFETHDDTNECLWMLKLNNTVANGSLIHIEIFDMNISCANNALYVYSSLMDLPKYQMQKRLMNYICRDQQHSMKIIEESKTGEMSIYYRRKQNGEGFNAVISILSCQMRTCRDPFHCDEYMNCVCPHMRTGVRCDIELCPNNCSESANQGQCDFSSNRCICKEGFNGEDCSKVTKKTSIFVSEIFNTQSVPHQLSHLKKTLPRFGHTLNADRKGFLWIFGGYSISNGALNDLRSFDSENQSWMQVTVDGSVAPVGRYFHSSIISKQGLYTYGGMTNEAQLLNDFWMFNMQEHRWSEIKTNNTPGFISGHTMSLVKFDEHDKIILIGGMSNGTQPEERHLVWEFSFVKKTWNRVNYTGTTPIAIYGHTTVYHAHSKVFYIFGGLQMVHDRMRVSKRLFSLVYKQNDSAWRWSLLPTFSELNRPEELLPRARFMHSSVGFSQFMIVFGGETSPRNLSDYLNAYVFKCNSWIRLTESVEIIGYSSAENLMIGQAVAVESSTDHNNFYVVGGKNSKFSIVKISMPSDICQLWGTSKHLCRFTRGCSYGQVTTENSKSMFCFSSNQKDSIKDEMPFSTNFHYGSSCEDSLLMQRNCSSFLLCEECEAMWPNESTSSCQWCTKENCGKSARKCVPRKTHSINETIVVNNDVCSDMSCSAFDCESCSLKPGCNWTKVGDIFKCYSSEKSTLENLETFPECPRRCDKFLDCATCLTATSNEGGHGDCLWSTMLGKCFAPSQKSLQCSGGSCGLLLSKSELNQCPLRCEAHQMCSKCLQNAHCGWCSRDEDDLGDGVCVEGNIKGPLGEVDNISSICSKTYEEFKGLQRIRRIFSKISEEIAKKPNMLEEKMTNSLETDYPTIPPTTLVTDDFLNLKSLSEKFQLLSNMTHMKDELSNSSTSIRNSSEIIKSYTNFIASTQGQNFVLQSTFSWHYMTCPPENECENDHHTCNRKTEKCIDFLEGFKCECAAGYQLSEESGQCMPICDNGCDHGQCIEPNNCECDFGWVGKNCSIQCQCSGHSNCAGPDQLDVCLECHNNTIGKQCEKCDKFFVGDPKNNGKCQSCFDYCHGHSEICVADFREEFRSMSKSQLAGVLTEGAKSKAVCLKCMNNTNGSRCDSCLSGYFRGSANLRHVCKKCECNGHGDICDPVTGEKCNCGNNTESDNTCPAKYDKNNAFQCWLSQCSKCRETYSGSPKNGHQCYKHITIDSRMCLDARPIEACRTETFPLNSGRTVFFVVQPRFMNVDIRITLDITQGEVDFFMSSNDDSFVVLANQSNSFHEIYLDSKYQWIQVDNNNQNLNITPLVTSSKKLFDNATFHHSYDDRILDCRSLGKFHVLDKTAQAMTTHIRLEKCNTLLRVFRLKNRLVVTLPQNVWNLSGTRFYIALRAAYQESVTGLLFFRSVKFSSHSHAN